MKKSVLLFEIVFAIMMGFVACSDKENEKLEIAAEDEYAEYAVIDESDISSELQSAQYRAFIFGMDNQNDCILEAYRNYLFYDKVTAFFGIIVGSNELASLILKEASERNLSPSIVFALSWEESRFNHQAVNQNRNNTIDRGLFQLNSSSFPDLKEADFFDPETNTRNAMAHLRWCLDYAESEVAGLAMYNAGSNRVRNGETPKKTLDYVSRILRNSEKIEELFLEEMNIWTAEIAAAEESEAEAEESYSATLNPIDSLALALAGFLNTYP